MRVQKKIGLWPIGAFDQVDSSLPVNGNDGSSMYGLPTKFKAKVLEIGPGDSFMVQNPKDGAIKRIFFSSTIFPKRHSPNIKQLTLNSSNKIFIIPYLFEAREHLRRNYFRKTLNFHLDYVVEANNYAPERICCTVTNGSANIACELISKGLALCMKHKKDDKSRSQCYSALVEAENHAMTNKLGIHSSVFETKASKCVDMCHAVDLIRPILPKLIGLGKTKVIVETILTPVRFRLYVPEMNILISFILEGLMSPKYSTSTQEQDKFFTEALQFSRSLCLNRNATVEFYSCDRGGNLIGNMSIDNTDVTVSILSNGYGYINWSLLYDNANEERLKMLQEVQSIAKLKSINIWSLDQISNSLSTAPITLEHPRVISYQQCMISDIKNGLDFSIQLASNESVINMIHEALNLETELLDVGEKDIFIGNCVAAQDIDGHWYRSEITQFDDNDDNMLVRFIDYGNTKVVRKDEVKEIPQFLSDLMPQSTAYSLAFVSIPSVTMMKSYDVFKQLVSHQVLLMNVEYSRSKNEATNNLNDAPPKNNLTNNNDIAEQKPKKIYVSLSKTEENIDVVSNLLQQGLAVLDQEIDIKHETFQKLMQKYKEDQQLAISAEVGYWSKATLGEFDSMSNYF